MPILLKLEREKAPFLEEAPGKLEPHMVVKLKLVHGQAGEGKLYSYHSPLGPAYQKAGATKGR